MGTDISCVIEKMDAMGRWRFDRPLHLWRNYTLFSILALDHDDNPCIAQPRHEPSDFDRANACTCEDWPNPEHHQDDGWEMSDLHTCSWLYLSELLAYDWERQVPFQCLIPLREVDHHADYETYVQWRATAPHPPHGGLGGSTGIQMLDLRPIELVQPDLNSPYADARHRAAADIERMKADRVLAERMIADPTLMPEPVPPPPGALYREQGGLWEHRLYPRKAWALIHWTEPARQACAQFYQWLETMLDQDEDRVRIVFGFS